MDRFDSPLAGLTGGIACGKSTVAHLLRDWGALIVDADLVARDVVKPGSDGLAQLVQTFGSSVINPAGGLNRPRLGQIIFKTPELRQTLNSILHPLIALESARQIQAARAERPPLVIYDAALLIEAGRADAFRPLIVVRVSPDIQRARLMSRDPLSRTDAEARIASQMPVAQKVRLADYVIDNDGDRAATEIQVAALWKELVQ